MWVDDPRAARQMKFVVATEEKIDLGGEERELYILPGAEKLSGD